MNVFILVVLFIVRFIYICWCTVVIKVVLHNIEKVKKTTFKDSSKNTRSNTISPLPLKYIYTTIQSAWSYVQWAIMSGMEWADL